MKILFATPEAVPFAKTGGLADVSGALPRALAKLGHEVTLVLPKYRQIDAKRFPIASTGVTVRVPISRKTESAEVYAADLAPNLRALFLRNDAYYDRDQLYGMPAGDFEDNAERFIFFSRAVLEAALDFDLAPEIIHCNDWQTGLVPVYLKTFYAQAPGLAQAASIFTIHNLGYQGLFWHYDMPLTNLGWELFTPQGLEYYGRLNFLKGGIVFADAVTTVSRRYMEEIQTPELGFGLDGVLRDRREDLYGILNGVDYEEWSPSSDRFIKAHYAPHDLGGKKACKADLQKEFGLPVAGEVPVLGAISRLADQKGFDLIVAILEKIIGLGMQFVLLGTGEEKYHLMFRGIQQKYPERAGIRLVFDEALAHKIEAGSDMFLMPSRYEPCGLNQIYSLKYGTVPIVRACGGLDDTIQDFDPERDEGNGFKFHTYAAECLLGAIQRAVRAYQNRETWQRLMVRGMFADFSWDQSARAYLEVYAQTLSKKKGRGERG